MSTSVVRKIPLVCKSAEMAIGKRIEQRLNDLKWKRRDLMDRVPDLTPQALSNLINRDSARSEWDMQIAEALGVSVMWLVYGIDQTYTPVDRAPNVTTLEIREPGLTELEALARQLSEAGLRELIGQARLLATIHPRTKANPAA